MFQKNRFLFVLLFTVQSLFAQIPQGFNYQATVRNQTGELLTNKSVNFKFHILQGSSDATPTYSESHNISTDDLGVVHLSIGSGNAEAGAFSQIDWSLGNYHMGIEINTGDGFIDMGTTQLMSVPFALYALNSGNGLPMGNSVGNTTYWNGKEWVTTSNNLFNDGKNVMIGTSAAEPSSAFTVASTSQGVLLPKMTLMQRDAIQSPTSGLLIFQTDNTPGYYYYDGASWKGLIQNNTLIYTTNGF